MRGAECPVLGLVDQALSTVVQRQMVQSRHVQLAFGVISRRGCHLPGHSHRIGAVGTRCGRTRKDQKKRDNGAGSDPLLDRSSVSGGPTEEHRVSVKGRTRHRHPGLGLGGQWGGGNWV